ncbi:hypothetical protein P9112_005513 [Eukaryota sp. TZLM1-RC]
MPNGNNNYCASQAHQTANSNSAVNDKKMSGVCQTSFRGDPSNPPLHIISSTMSAPTKEPSTPPSSTSSDVVHPTPGQTSSSVSHSTHGTLSSGATHPTPNIDESSSFGSTPHYYSYERRSSTPPPNPSSGQNPTPNLTLPEVTPPNNNAHSTATTALTTAKVSQDKPPATFSKEESEKQEPTDFVEPLPSDTSLYPDLEYCVSVQTLNETLEGFREVPLTSQVRKNSIELLDKESKELSGRPAERRIRLSPLDSSYKSIMSKLRADRFDFIGKKATLDIYNFRIRWLEVMEYGRGFSNNLDGPENIHLLPDWFRPGLDKIYEVNSISGVDYTVVREVYEYYPSSSNPDLVEMRPASQPFRLIFVEQGVTFKRDHANMKTAVISTYRSPPNHHNVQIGDTWVNNKAFAFTPILGIEDTPFQSIRPFRLSIQLNIQEESKPLQKLQIDQLPQPGNQKISMDVLTIQPSDSSVPMEESTSHQTGPGLSKQDLSSSRSGTLAGIHDPRQVLDLNLQSHVGYHY